MKNMSLLDYTVFMRRLIMLCFKNEFVFQKASIIIFAMLCQRGVV